MLAKKYVVLLMSFTFTLLFAKSPQHEVITKTLTAEKGGTLEVKLNPGEVYIKTWERNEVLVKIDGLDERESEELEFSERRGNVSVEYDGKWGWGKSAEYYFTVPQNFNVKVYTTGGDIKIEDDLDGNISVQTMGGNVEMRSLTGDLSLETMGGDIVIGDVDGSAYISTQGGDIKIGSLNGSTKEVKTMGGDIDIHTVNEVRKITTYGGDIDVGNAKQNLEVITFGGSIDLKNCDAGVKASTYGGNIIVRKANGSVDVSSGGGNINLEKISGAVRARTGAGDIFVEFNEVMNEDSDLRTSAGDVELTIPASSEVKIFAEVNSYWGEGANTIKSDFEGRVSKNRGDFNATYEINGGGNEINIRASNGTISIKKK